MRNWFSNLKVIRKKGILKCPDCDEFMELFACQNVIIDKCRACDGIWFDDKEFRIFKRTLDSFDLEKIQEIYHPVDDERMSISSCPRCLEVLEEVNYSYNSGVKIKKCNRCAGLWLPLCETLNLMKLAKISQNISEDVQGLAGEIKNQENERLKNQKIKKFGNQIGQPVGHWRWLFARYFFVLIPMYDENPRKQFPLVTVGLIALNIASYFILNLRAESLSLIFKTYGMQPFEVVNGTAVFSLITSQFLHSGIFHLLGNIFFLWTFGDNVEDILGKLRFFCFYIFCGFMGNVFHILSGPDSLIPILGASGAISGILGAYIYLFPRVNIKTLVLGLIVDCPAWAYLGIWVLIQGVGILLQSAGASSSVAWWAHIGGFVTGLFLLFIYNRIFKGVLIYTR